MYLKIIAVFATIFAALCSHDSYAATSDSVPGLAQALADLPPDRSVLDLAEGTYTIASTWSILRAGVTIRGAGIGKTILIRDPQFNGIMVNMDGANGKITGLTIDGSGTARVIFLRQPGVVADTIEVKNFTHIGIAVAASDCRVSKCLVTGLGIPSAGIWYDAGPSVTASTIMVDHSTITNSDLYCTGGTVTITDNQLSRNHCERVGGGGQIDCGNAFTKNTVATISGNTIVNGAGAQAGGIEMGGGSFIVKNNTLRNHGLAGMTLNHNVIRATITGNTISNSGHYLPDKNTPPARSGIYVMYGATNIEISNNRIFDDQSTRTQTWGIILAGLPTRPDPRFSPRATEHVVVRNNDLRGNIHPEGLLDESGARDRIVGGNLPPQTNRH